MDLNLIERFTRLATNRLPISWQIADRRARRAYEAPSSLAISSAEETYVLVNVE